MANSLAEGLPSFISSGSSESEDGGTTETGLAMHRTMTRHRPSSEQIKVAAMIFCLFVME